MTTAPAEQEAGLGFADALVRLSHLVQHVYAEVSRANGLTSQQAYLLCILVGSPAGMTELSQLLHLEKSSLTGLVDRVERRGLVGRTRDTHDRRAWQVALTDEGIRLANTVHQGITEQLEALADDLTSATRTQTVSLITELLRGRGATFAVGDAPGL